MAPVTRRKTWLGAACCMVVVSIAAVSTLAAPATAEIQVAELDAKSREILDEMHQLLKEVDANDRRSCAMGDAPRWVGTKLFEDDKKPRTIADVAGMCVALLGGMGGEGRLPELYRELLVRLGGDVAGAGVWPRAIGAALLAGKNDVGIGHHKTIEVKPALAFDAGFTVAFQEGKNGQGQDAAPAQLLAIAEGCVSQRQDAATCFSAGYIYGANAVRDKTLSSR